VRRLLAEGMKTLLVLTWTILVLPVSATEAAAPVNHSHPDHQPGLSLHDDLLGVFFLNPERGWVCGRRGTILQTSDGGLTWSRRQTGTDQTLTAVFFAQEETGWAVGDEGTILHTRDGGATWVKQQSPVSFYLMDVVFVSPRSGWIVTEQTHILHTDDGGLNWRIRFQDLDFILKAVSFADPLTGWAVGEYGFIYHTGDGGATWQQQAGFYGLSKETDEIEGGYSLFDVAAVDTLTAWAVGIDGQVLRTVDGGKTWGRIITGAPATQLFSVAANQRGTVVIAGRGVLLFSMDGGASWVQARLGPSLAWGWLYGLARSGLRDFFAVGREGSIYRSGGDLERWLKILE
jgi:photosystem II stability/assembly factor-like uncharacterized protein